MLRHQFFFISTADDDLVLDSAEATLFDNTLDFEAELALALKFSIEDERERLANATGQPHLKIWGVYLFFSYSVT